MVFNVLAYRDDRGKAPVVEWILGLSVKARRKVFARLERLKEHGHMLRRPETEYPRDGVYELRATYRGMQYGILYFFFKRTSIILTHGLTKKTPSIPEREIERAIARKQAFQGDPAIHTYEGEL